MDLYPADLADYRLGDDELLAAFGLDGGPDPADPLASSPIGSLLLRPALRRRNAVAYATVRSWRGGTRATDMAAFKAFKAAPDPAVVEACAGEIADLAALLYGAGGCVVTCVPCGHSQRPDCIGKRLAQRVAALLGAPFAQAFADRFCSGVSHPKEFARLPPLESLAELAGPVLVVDDLATSGWHIEEAVGRLRLTAAPVMAVAWLGGTVAG